MAFIEERMQHQHAINHNLQIEEVGDVEVEFDNFHIEVLFDLEDFDNNKFEEIH